MGILGVPKVSKVPKVWSYCHKPTANSLQPPTYLTIILLMPTFSPAVIFTKYTPAG